MRKDGTHSERELKELDRRVSEIWTELNDLINAHEKDEVGLSLAYARPKKSRKAKDDAVYGVCVAGLGGALIAGLTELFGNYPELFLGVLDRVAEKHPEKFRMHVVTKPKDDMTLS